jgi:hypothetical protein
MDSSELDAGGRARREYSPQQRAARSVSWPIPGILATAYVKDSAEYKGQSGPKVSPSPGLMLSRPAGLPRSTTVPTCELLAMKDWLPSR